MRRLARQVADETHELPVRSSSTVASGNTKHTELVRLADDREIVVQLGPPTRLDTAVAVWREIDQRTTVPTASLLDSGTIESDGQPLGFAVWRRVLGQDLHEVMVDLSAAQRESLAQKFGAVLGELHAVLSFDHYGTVCAGVDGLESDGADVDWRSWFARYLERGLSALGPGLSGLEDDLRATFDPAAVPEAPSAALFPWDLRPGNTIVSPVTGTIAAILDWDDPLVAAPGLALAKAEYLLADWYVPSQSRDLRHALRSGYERHRPLPAVPPVYRVAAIVHSAYDSDGRITRPGYPEWSATAARKFHRDHLERLCDGQVAARRPNTGGPRTDPDGSRPV